VHDGALCEALLLVRDNLVMETFPERKTAGGGHIVVVVQGLLTLHPFHTRGGMPVTIVLSTVKKIKNS
jgi:hypothetical protein